MKNAGTPVVSGRRVRLGAAEWEVEHDVADARLVGHRARRGAEPSFVEVSWVWVSS